jgi:integrase/recombinase XerD
VPIRGAGKRALDPRRFEAVLEALAQGLAVRHRSAAAIQHARQAAGLLFAFLRRRRVRDLRAVTDAHVTAFARELQSMRSSRSRPYAIATQRYLLAGVQQLFRFLESREAILHNPALDLRLPSWRLLPHATINQEQARRLIAHPDPHTNRGKRSRAILELLYGTGLRVGECERLDLADVNLGQGVLFVRDGKGRKDRVVPLLGRAADALETYLRDARPVLLKDPQEPALFLTKHGTRVRAKAIQYLVRMHARRAEIPQPLSPHQLRHACATHLLQRGADVRHVQQLLGHASLDSTAIYTEVAPVDLAQAIDRAHPRSHLRRRARRGRR